jgi:hypothetical protein
MSQGPSSARTTQPDPVLAAIESAPLDERPVTEEERLAVKAAKDDPRPPVPGHVMTARIAERARREG